MASIIKVDELKEKTTGSGITLGHALKNSSGTEIMSAAGVFSSNIDGGTISNATLASSNKIESLVGMIAAFAMSSPPTGWLACQGQTLDSTTDTEYAPLFTAIGTTWGGTGSSSFLLPDLRGAFLRGADSQTYNSVNYNGESVGSKSNDDYKTHSHSIVYKNDNNDTEYSPFTNIDGTSYGTCDNEWYLSATYGQGDRQGGSCNYRNRITIKDSGTGTETKPFNASILYCIRWK